MSAPKISTLKELKESNYKPSSIKEELRRNLIKSIKAKDGQIASLLFADVMTETTTT